MGLQPMLNAAARGAVDQGRHRSTLMCWRCLWHPCRLIDLSLRRLVYGSLAGGLAALVLLRGPATRGAAVAFGAGCGVGSAWQACAKDVSSCTWLHLV